MMLRNAAAALLTLSFAVSFFALAPAALALDAIDLAEPQGAPASGECPLLVRIKYPFLSCAAEEGQALLQARPLRAEPAWSNTRQIPLMSDWTEGDGAWGPDLNQD